MATTAATAVAGYRGEVPGAQVPCPQCGGLLEPPHQVETFTCPWCGSTLHPGSGLRVFHLAERPRLGRVEAEEAMLAWFSGPDTPRGLEDDVSAELGDLRTFPYLRRRGAGLESITPLAALPQPELLDLPRVPADMVRAEPVAGDDRRSAQVGGATSLPVDEEALRENLRAAAGDPGVREALIEERAYYPVRYTYRREHFTAVVSAGSGVVLSHRRPARREVVGEHVIAVGTCVLLFAEAVAVPGLVAKLMVVAVTAAALFPLVRWLAAARL